MNACTTTPNGATSLILDSQRIFESHVDMMEFFNS